MNTILKTLFLSTAALFLTACASTTIPKPLEKNSKIAVASFMSDDALVISDSNAFSSSDTKITLYDFYYDNYLENNIVSNLKHNGYTHVIKIDTSKDDRLITISPIRTSFAADSIQTAMIFRGNGPSQMANEYIKQRIQPGEYDVIVNVLPDFSIPDGPYGGEAMRHFRYGVDVANLLGFQTGKGYYYINYCIDIWDGNTFKTIAYNCGHSAKEADGGNWPKDVTEDYKGIVNLKSWLKGEASDDINSKILEALRLK